MSRGVARPGCARGGERLEAAIVGETRHEHPLGVRCDQPPDTVSGGSRLDVEVEPQLGERLEGLREGDETAAVGHELLELVEAHIGDLPRVAGHAPEIVVVEQHDRSVSAHVAVGLDVRGPAACASATAAKEFSTTPWEAASAVTSPRWASTRGAAGDR